jgi:hypothetical protein
MGEFLTLKQAADVAGLSTAQVKGRMALGELKPTQLGTSTSTGETTYLFSDEDVLRLKFMSSTPTKDTKFVDDGKQTDFTVSQIASMWQLSTDTIQRLFRDEAGVITLSGKNRKKRTTLRIPRQVMERVKRRRSNV